MPKRTIDAREGRSILDIASYARLGPQAAGRLSPAQVEQIVRTVSRTPEVMVKVSGGGRSVATVQAHLAYIDRHGRLEIETDDGGRLQGKGIEKTLVENWDLDLEPDRNDALQGGQRGRGPSKLVHNIVFSMPARTPPDRLLAAVREFAREEFALKHRYALVLHTDQDHPHVHVVVKALSEQGVRLNIRKAMLREWREHFARQLREKGVAANATARVIRGGTGIRKSDGIYRAMLRGSSSHLRRRAEVVAAELRQGGLATETGKTALLASRELVTEGWKGIAGLLGQQGENELARRVAQFASGIPPARTDNECIAEQLHRRAHGRDTTCQGQLEIMGRIER